MIFFPFIHEKNKKEEINYLYLEIDNLNLKKEEEKKEEERVTIIEIL